MSPWALTSGATSSQRDTDPVGTPDASLLLPAQAGPGLAQIGDRARRGWGEGFLLQRVYAGASARGPLAPAPLEQFQEKCEAVFRPELRKNKEIEPFRDSKKSGMALAVPQERGDRDRCEREYRQLPEIAALLQPGKAERLDDLNRHDGQDDEGERLRHALPLINFVAPCQSHACDLLCWAAASGWRPPSLPRAGSTTVREHRKCAKPCRFRLPEWRICPQDRTRGRVLKPRSNGRGT